MLRDMAFLIVGLAEEDDGGNGAGTSKKNDETLLQELNKSVTYWYTAQAVRLKNVKLWMRP